VPFTLVSFHAHPDDEALLTGGTLARAAAEGHRLVLVTATDGDAGGSAPGTAPDRRAELDRAAAALGCARVVRLGYPDSGWRSPTRPGAFGRLDVEAPARRLAALLTAEGADALTVYDPSGGYGHLDHRQVHRVGVRAAELAGTPVVLEATVDRDLLRRLQPLVRLLMRAARVDSGISAADLAHGFTARARITHRVDVRGQLPAKRRALAAHGSQTASGSGTRWLALLLGLPDPVLGAVVGREWFVERGRAPAGVPLDDVFASLRPGSPAPTRLTSTDRPPG
jgi:LmbE family N-acetylglucosaminyl deacetylase